jgi:hypothetical protein
MTASLQKVAASEWLGLVYDDDENVIFAVTFFAVTDATKWIERVMAIENEWIDVKRGLTVLNASLRNCWLGELHCSQSDLDKLIACLKKR